ncbi:MAG: DNA polymerase III subunit chi [Alphaproteobacteria bacterium]|nr:DNA polymerase III subunit chi [Alphaproteobacteria bacterium]
MTDIRFYHLTKTPEDQALPQIAMKAMQSGGRVVVRAADEGRVDSLNDALWTFRADVFLPHGTKDDGYAEQQPIWLTAGNDNPNGAKTLILAAGCQTDDLTGFDLCCIMLDGRDEAGVEAARGKWKAYKEAGHTISYWQQTDKGWEKKA